MLQLIAEGNANKQIAFELGISIKTVEKHRQHLMQKLSIHDIAGLTRYAIAAGVIESSVQRTTNAPESYILYVGANRFPQMKRYALAQRGRRGCRVSFPISFVILWRSVPLVL